MKKTKILILALSCLLTACGVSETAPHSAVGKTGGDSAAIFQSRAYEEMFNGSLARAETYAYRAFLMSRDTTLECDALSLLCYIYYREGKQEELQLLMQTISPEIYMSAMDVQSQVEQARAGSRCTSLPSLCSCCCLLSSRSGMSDGQGRWPASISSA